jgi:hypothetical protein
MKVIRSLLSAAREDEKTAEGREQGAMMAHDAILDARPGASNRRGPRSGQPPILDRVRMLAIVSA